MGATYGIMAEFRTPGEVLEATQRAYAEGYRKMDVYSPFPIHGIEKALGLPGSKVPWIVLAGGLSGASLGMFLQYWTSAVDYPLIIGGKPFFSYPAFVPVTFECMVLLAAFGAVFGMLALNKLPQFFHPVFRHPTFRRASDDRFFLSIERDDPRYDDGRTRQLLETLGGENIMVLEA